MPQNGIAAATPQQKALDAAGVTTEAIGKLKAQAEGLKITGPDDKAGFAAVDRARIDCKKLRTTAVRTCKAGREEAQRTVREWQSAEKEIVGRIVDIENPLIDAQEWYQNENARIAREAEEARRQKIEQRIEAFVAVNSIISYADAEALTDEEFAERYAEAEDAFELEQQRKADEERQRQLDAEANERAGRRVAELAAVGGQITYEDAKRLTNDEFQSVLKIATEAKARRDAEEAERQRIGKRLEQLAKVSTHIDYEVARTYDDEQFAVYLKSETEKHDERVAREQQAAAEVPEIARAPASLQPSIEPVIAPDAPAVQNPGEAVDLSRCAAIERDRKILFDWLHASCSVQCDAILTEEAAPVAQEIMQRLHEGFFNWAVGRIESIV